MRCTTHSYDEAKPFDGRQAAHTKVMDPIAKWCLRQGPSSWCHPKEKAEQSTYAHVNHLGLLHHSMNQRFFGMTNHQGKYMLSCILLEHV
jgi:hypothetical protein